MVAGRVVATDGLLDLLLLYRLRVDAARVFVGVLLAACPGGPEAEDLLFLLRVLEGVGDGE